MNISSSIVSPWRSLTDKLTPEQVRHLEADERIATDALQSPDAHARTTGQEILDSLHDEAAYYASHNTPVGIEMPSAVEVFRNLLRIVKPADLRGKDVDVMLDLLRGWAGWQEPANRKADQ